MSAVRSLRRLPALPLLLLLACTAAVADGGPGIGAVGGNVAIAARAPASADDVARTPQAPSPNIASLIAQAVRYEHGEGVTQDLKLAYDLYCMAAKEGDAQAQYSLGWMYANGRGVPRDDEIASLFFNMAAEQGHAQAKAMLPRVGPAAREMPPCMREFVIVFEPPPPRVEAPVQVAAADDLGSFVPANAAQERLATLVRAIAPQYNVHPLLALAFIRAESNFDPLAVSPKNAQGLMQLIPETSARFAVKRPFDTVQNLRGGLAYLRWLLAYFRGSVPLVAAAYNSGEKTVDRYRGVPPYPETRQYVKRIMEVFHKAWHPFDPGAADPSPELDRIRGVNAR